ncbi:ESPR domain-containing protein, partial [Megasphaera stantonii]
MNRIYKVIWSKVKHQYVVVSELAHSCTKSTSSRVGRSAAAVLAALVLTTGVCAVPVQAEDLTDPYALLNEKVEKSKNSDPIVELVQSPLAKAASETTAETNSDNQPADEEATTPTQPADSQKQHTIINQDGIYASNGKGTYNTLSKDGLWVGGRDDGEGLYVDNDGNMRTTGNVMVDGAFSAGDGNAYIAKDGSTSIQVGGSQFIVNSDIAGMSNGNASVSVMNNSAEVRAADNLIAAGIDGITMSEQTGNTTVTVNQDGMTVDGDLTVTGDTNLKDTGVDGTLNVSGNQTVGGNSTVKGSQEVLHDLT